MFKQILIAAFIVLAMVSSANAEKTIIFASDTTWPPMEFVNSDKEIVGYSIDFMTAAAKEAGFKAVFKSVAWDGIFAGLANNKYDAICSSVEITEKRQKTMGFSEPYYKVSQALVVPSDSNAKTIQDLKGKTVAAQIGTTGYFAIKKVDGVNAKSYDEIGLAFEDMRNGRIDAVVCDDPVAAQFANQKQEYMGKMKLVENVPTEVEGLYAIAVKKGNDEILELVNKGIAAVKAKGLDKELKAKWITGE